MKELVVAVGRLPVALEACSTCARGRIKLNRAKLVTGGVLALTFTLVGACAPAEVDREPEARPETTLSGRYEPFAAYCVV